MQPAGSAILIKMQLCLSQQHSVCTWQNGVCCMSQLYGHVIGRTVEHMGHWLCMTSIHVLCAGEHGCCISDRVPDAHQTVASVAGHRQTRCPGWTAHPSHEVEPDNTRRVCLITLCLIWLHAKTNTTMNRMTSSCAHETVSSITL